MDSLKNFAPGTHALDGVGEDDYSISSTDYDDRDDYSISSGKEEEDDIYNTSSDDGHNNYVSSVSDDISSESSGLFASAFCETADVKFSEKIPKLDLTNLGENKTLQYTKEGVGDIRVAMFSGLVRNISLDKIDDYINDYLMQYENLLKEDKKKAKHFLCDLFLLAFEKRDCRGGEGEKKIFYHMIWRLFHKCSWITSHMLELISEFGSWKDYFEIINHIRNYNYERKINKETNNLDYFVKFNKDEDDEDIVTACKIENESTKRYITQVIIDIIDKQFKKDVENLINDKEISLLAKWLPTERCEFARHNKYVWTILLNRLILRYESTNIKERYRKLVVEMREKINVTESLMCEGKYSSIDPLKTPSVCSMKFRKAFLNILTESEALKQGRQAELEREERETGNRYPDNNDRVTCRKNWIKAIKEKKIKGSQLTPDQLVEALSNVTTSDEINLLNAQWEDLLKNIRGRIEQAKKDGYDVMDNIIPMIDMSPSMDGQPKNAAIGLGIMLSELNSKKYGGIAITFDDKCHTVNLKDAKTFADKVELIKSLPMGYSTNFNLAMERICEIIENFKIPEDQVPSLCILSDEQFDHVQFGYDATMEDQMVEMFNDIGIKISGQPYKKPRTIHWNLRGDTDGFPSTADAKNVQMIAGYSPALFDLILCGKPEPTPYDTMRRKLDSSRYDEIRRIFNENYIDDSDW